MTVPPTSPGTPDPSPVPTPITPGVLAVAQRAVSNEELATNHKRLVTAYGIATVLVPAFALTDFAREWAWPHHTALATALVIRSIAMGIIGGAWLRLRMARALSERELDFWVNALTPFLAVVIALLSLCISGVDSPYTDAVNLVATGYAFVPRRWTKVVGSAVTAVIAFPSTFLVAALFWDRARAELSEPAFAMDLVIETAIFAATVAVLAYAAHLLWALRREVFAARSIGRYRVQKRLGRGGMGEVWSAFDETLKRNVALKVLRLDHADAVALARFEREVRATIELTHPNTVRVLDVGVTDDGISYYAMELLEGEPLGALLRREKPLPPARAIHFALQAARALAEAHARGIVHRDVKPENLYVTRAGDEPDFLKVLDFGIARLDRAEHTQLTQTGMVAGTPQYLAPEVIEGGDATPAADVYALGVVLYEMLAGTPPYGRVEGPALLIAHLTTEAAPPSAHAPVGSSIDRIVMRCLRKRPSERFASARELADALIELGLAETWRPSSAPPPQPTMLHDASPDGETQIASPKAARGG
ncbi:serine/threonine-protein kinase [Sandaracinus amylolyticus]|uniref:serine/threonine-protein kinase n=1 Tax=Sandaracinus amylolyticus TaxID=927083 RepID=UPI001F34CF95|nr:serine/threonine-protein kinase [Sandaracinus amylolyticus]UJR78947.1 Serine/threonine protein kinase PrkC, regulator of stationary phase [Sandaracinus amylolyticus]